MGTIFLVLLALLVVVPAGFGLLWRIGRAGPGAGLGRPLVMPGLPAAAVIAALTWIVGQSQWALILGVLGGVLAMLVALGLDEFFDRIAGRFYAMLRREVRSYFGSAISWFVLVLFVWFMGIQFWSGLSEQPILSMFHAFQPMVWIIWFLFPLLTMGIFARERAEGTDEVLLTAPVSETSVVLAKYLGFLVFFAVVLVPSFVQLGLLRAIGDNPDFSPGTHIGKPELGPVVTGYVGMLLQGGMFAALGVFTSSLTASQILAAILSWIGSILFLMMGMLVTALGLLGTDLGQALEYISPFEHLNPFLRGVIDPKDLVYFLSFSIFFLFLAVRMVESRKWR